MSGKRCLKQFPTRANTEAEILWCLYIAFRNLRAGHVGFSQTTDTNTIFQSLLFRLDTFTVKDIEKRCLQCFGLFLVEVHAIAENKLRPFVCVLYSCLHSSPAVLLELREKQWMMRKNNWVENECDEKKLNLLSYFMINSRCQFLHSCFYVQRNCRKMVEKGIWGSVWLFVVGVCVHANWLKGVWQWEWPITNQKKD